jgi:decaprenylphospho-beta-D-ribofuranose 2-oxidase
MVNATKMELSGWGRYPRSQSLVHIPETVSEIDLHRKEQSIARGLGRSYGNAAMLENGVVVITERLKQSVSLDESTGLLTAEAGLSLADLLSMCVSKGWFPPVVPGTKWVTLGGCVAADIHGKNHHRHGTFGAHVSELELLLANGELVQCSRANDPELFWATIGGMGLTGIITKVRVQLVPIESSWIITQQQESKDLDASLAILETAEWDDVYSVAWLDCLASGKQLGRTILIKGHHARAEELPVKLRNKPARTSQTAFRLGFDLPSWVLNELSVKTFNEAYYRRQRRRTKPFVCNPDKFFFPLDQISNWNRMYGKRGFVQYQCVLPPQTARQGLQSLLEESQRSKRPSFLAVLKRFGPQNEGLLSFPMEGYTLTMDFPVSDPGLFPFLDRLDEIVVKHGGRVYLAKDARMQAETFRAMYSRFDEWSRIKQRVDPEHRFDSDLARRLAMTASREQTAVRRAIY